MKKLSTFVLSALLVMTVQSSALANHEGMAQGEMVKVYQCPMDKYAVSAKCPICGMNMEEKKMTAADAKAAIGEAKEKMRNRA